MSHQCPRCGQIDEDDVGLYRVRIEDRSVLVCCYACWEELADAGWRKHLAWRNRWTLRVVVAALLLAAALALLELLVRHGS